MNVPEEVGQTIGRAIESITQQDCPRQAISAGVIAEMYIATKLFGLPHDILLSELYEVKENFPPLNINCEGYPSLLHQIHTLNGSGETMLRLMMQDGKLSDAKCVSDEVILEGIDFYRESYGQ